MAHVMPSNPSELRLAGAPELELVTLEDLAEALPDDYTVFHGVHWAGMTPTQQRFGEIDFVIVNQSGDLLLIEQKNGALIEDDDALFKEYANTGDRKSVVGQLRLGRDWRGDIHYGGWPWPGVEYSRMPDNFAEQNVLRSMQ